MISLADQMGLPQEQGRMKWLTNYIRFGSNILDMIPALGAEDIPAAVLTGAAGVIDSVSCLLEGNMKGAAEEFVCGAAETGITLLPFVEYASLVGADLRKIARYATSSLFNTCVGGESCVYTGDRPIDVTASRASAGGRDADTVAAQPAAAIS